MAALERGHEILESDIGRILVPRVGKTFFLPPHDLVELGGALVDVGGSVIDRRGRWYEPARLTRIRIPVAGVDGLGFNLHRVTSFSSARLPWCLPGQRRHPAAPAGSDRSAQSRGSFWPEP